MYKRNKYTLSDNDSIVVSLLYALDCIDAGKLGEAKSNIKQSLVMLPREDMGSIHDALTSMLEGVEK